MTEPRLWRRDAASGRGGARQAAMDVRRRSRRRELSRCARRAQRGHLRGSHPPACHRRRDCRSGNPGNGGSARTGRHPAGRASRPAEATTKPAPLAPSRVWRSATDRQSAATNARLARRVASVIPTVTEGNARSQCTAARHEQRVVPTLAARTAGQSRPSVRERAGCVRRADPRRRVRPALGACAMRRRPRFGREARLQESRAGRARRRGLYSALDAESYRVLAHQPRARGSAHGSTGSTRGDQHPGAAQQRSGYNRGRRAVRTACFVWLSRRASAA
jgi:hypothetical protein